MKVFTMKNLKVVYMLLLAMPVLTMTGCYESNSEEPPPSTDNGGGTVLGVNDTLSVAVGSTGGSVDVLRNDANGVTITSFDSSSIQGGTVSQNGSTSTFTYIPPVTYSGTDSFTYTIQNSKGNSSVVTVTVTVNNDIIASGRDFFNKECGICHKAGSEDQQNAFGATDLALSTNNFDYDMSLSEQKSNPPLWDPPLMRYYSALSQKEVDGLRAYIGLIRSP